MVRSLLPLFILVSFLVPCLCQPTHLINCLIHQNINNFTTQTDPIVYYNLLKYSLQNLQFTEHLLPKPVAIILPESVEQLVRVASCCTSGSWEIRVRCGGHSYGGTSSVSFNGAPFVIIDMMNLNQVLVDTESETAWVEGGATLGETYYAIAAQSSNTLGFSAGACPTVGVGGHISGGGIGFMSRKYGLAADNVVDALLVDADGRLLDRKAMGEDVFWAIRGGGGGVWGIVYAWKIKLVKVPQIVTGFMISRSNKTHVAQLFQKWQYVASSESDIEFYLSVLVRAGLLDISATFAGFYLGPRNQLISILTRVFPELGVREEDCKEMNWIQSILYFSSLNNGSTVSDLKNRYLQEKSCLKAKSDYVRTPISIEGINIALDILEKEPKGYLYIEPYGGMMQNISSESIAFPHRKGNLYVIQYRVEWEEEDNIKGEEYIDWIRGFYDAMTPYVSWGPRAAYVNYMDLDLGIMEFGDQADDAIKKARVWGEKYFLNNYERLVKAKTLIDPRNVFNHQQGIPPSKQLRWS